MPTFGLGIGLVGESAYLPLQQQDFQEVCATFHANSGSIIDLRPFIVNGTFSPSASAVWAYQLHRATAQITGNPVQAMVASNVALIYSNVYGPREDVIGVMFDRGFATFDDPNDSAHYTSLPREGCAIFLGAIAGARTPATEQYRQAYYTTIHELGHLFNLMHRAGRSYMAQSGGGTSAPSEGFWQFVNEEKDWLARAGIDFNVWPGGAPFRDPAGAISAFDSALAARNFLSMSLSLSRHSFTYNEPAELTIQLKVLKGAPRGGLELPDEIDPGYARFNLWITDPDGERRRYKPINHYCPSQSTIVVKWGSPFVRDLSIHGQSGGFTFDKHGTHQIMAELKLGDAGTLVSNVVELEIRPPETFASVDQDMLNSRKVQSFLFYRDCDYLKDAMTLSKEVGALSHSPLKASLDYALARYMKTSAKTQPDRDELQGLSLMHANQAMDESRYLGVRQCMHLTGLLSASDSRIAPEQ